MRTNNKIIVSKNSETGLYEFDQIIEDEKSPLEVSTSSFFKVLNNCEFEDAFYYNKTPNFGVKVTSSKEIDGKIEKVTFVVVFRDFEKMKNDKYIKQLKEKIYPVLKKRAVGATKKLLISGVKKLTVVAGIAVIIIGGKTLYKNGLFGDKTVDNSSSIPKKNDSSIVQDDSSISDTNSTPVNVPVSDSSLVDSEEEKTNTDIKEKFFNYCKYFNYSDYLTNLLYEKSEGKFDNSENVDADIMEYLYSFYVDEIYDTITITKNTVDNDEQCCAILKYAKIQGIESKEMLYTMLAIHDFETGWGKSELCINSNNFGGNTFGDGFQVYPTYEVGAYDFVNDFIRIYKQTYSGQYSIEYDMGPVYCTENVEGNTTPWYVCIADVKDRLKSNGELDRLMSLLESKQSTEKKVENEKVKTI